MTKKKFLRRDARRFAKFGKGRGKKAKWKKPNGRDNKMREKRKGYQAVVSIGYRTIQKLRGTVEEKMPVTIFKVEELEKISKNQIAILGKVGKKRKIEIAKKAKELNVKIKNLNVNSFLKKEGKKTRKSQEKKSEKENKK